MLNISLLKERPIYSFGTLENKNVDVIPAPIQSARHADFLMRTPRNITCVLGGQLSFCSLTI